jgi:hypothetical protein
MKPGLSIIEASRGQDGMNRSIIVAVAALLVVAVVACSDSGTAAAPTPFHGIPAEFVTSAGSGDCRISGSEGVDPDSGEPNWKVWCDLDMSDPRVGGTEILDRIRVVERDGTGYVWVAEEATITNDGGTWRGNVQTADEGSQRNGEGHFVGEGAYEGLEYHYYFGVNEADEHIRTGWVYTSGG